MVIGIACSPSASPSTSSPTATPTVATSPVRSPTAGATVAAPTATPTAAPRGPQYGIAGVIARNFPNSSQGDWEALYTSLSATGDLLGVYTNWSDSDATKGEVPRAVATHFELGKRYNFTPLTGIGAHRDVGAGVEQTVKWTDPADRAKFQQTLVAIAQQYKPAYLFVGNEVNRTFDRDPAAFAGYVEAYLAAYDAIKAVSPNTLVFPVFQYELLLGKAFLMGGSETRKPQWDLLARFGTKMDAIGLTTYPYLDYGLPANVPDNYYTQIATHTKVPVIFTEIGWPSAALPKAPSSEHGGTPQEQEAFVRRFFTLTADVQVKAALWFCPNDIVNVFPDFGSIALRQVDGTPKPALAAWGERAAKR